MNSSGDSLQSSPLSTWSSTVSTSTVESNSSGSSFELLSDHQLALHIMFYNSLEMLSKRLDPSKIYYKITSMQLKDSTNNDSGKNNIDDDNSTLDWIEDYPFEIAVMNDFEFSFKEQNQFGRLFQKNEFVIFRNKISCSENIGLKVSLYQKNDHEKNPEKEAHLDEIGYGHIYPLNTLETNGIWTIPVTSKMGKIVAKFKAEYFIAKPFGCRPSTLEQQAKSRIRNIKSWELKKGGYNIGHRGAGCARRDDSMENVLENTIDSFNFAFEKGADMVELDVQLSKDKIPIVYHDFNVNLVLQKKDQESENFSMGIKDLTYQQLQKFKLKPLIKGNKKDYDFEDGNDKPNGSPFASLRTVLESVASGCGFNVEIKYPQKKINGDWEAEKSHDLNEYVDIILQDLFLYGDERNIIISSFHPEICSLVKLKQNRYPVLFLTQGLTTKWMAFENPLNHSIEMATYLALSMNLHGVAVHAEDIIKNTSLIQFVKEKNIVLFCWGDDLNDRDLIQNLKKQGVDGAIYDKIDLLTDTTWKMEE